MGIYLHFLSLQNRLKLRENRLKLKWRKFGKKKRGMNGAVECRPRREMGRSTPFKVMAQDGIKGVHQHCVDTPSCVKLIIRPGCESSISTHKIREYSGFWSPKNQKSENRKIGLKHYPGTVLPVVLSYHTR